MRQPYSFSSSSLFSASLSSISLHAACCGVSFALNISPVSGSIHSIGLLAPILYNSPKKPPFLHDNRNGISSASASAFMQFCVQRQSMCLLGFPPSMSWCQNSILLLGTPSSRNLKYVAMLSLPPDIKTTIKSYSSSGSNSSRKISSMCFVSLLPCTLGFILFPVPYIGLSFFPLVTGVSAVQSMSFMNSGSNKLNCPFIFSPSLCVKCSHIKTDNAIIIIKPGSVVHDIDNFKVCFSSRWLSLCILWQF